MSISETNITNFRDFALPAPLLSAVTDVGYETPSPIQAQTIPPLLQGHDVLGHAPTGTGKTAAFALPLLARVQLERSGVQVLILTPTRELAIQVAEAVQRYAARLPGFHVLPIYGGQDYGVQLRGLRRGAHVVVGTPGRVMDHMRKGTLRLDGLRALVLDEADEMLRMGFIDDVEWILQQTPESRQLALFSATMPREIQRIAARYLRNPVNISIQAKTATAETVRQRYWNVNGLHKLDALTRILEVEPFDALLIFVRTRLATAELADRLQARGYAAAALNGDLPQKQREQLIEKLKDRSIDILVATDVAARGLDVERISLVINYDIPYDTEAYIHRIGRTGRAGRAGDAILFVTPREQHLLRALEKATRQPLEKLALPTTEMVNDKRISDFKQRISDTLAGRDLGLLKHLLSDYQREHDTPALDIAAALAAMMLGDKPLLLEARETSRPARQDRAQSTKRTTERPSRSPAAESHAPTPVQASSKAGKRGVDREATPTSSDRRQAAPDHADRSAESFEPATDVERYRLAVGSAQGVKPANIVGAIANEAGLDPRYIGTITIHEDHSLVDLPAGMPKAIFKDLGKAWVCGRQLRISRLQDGSGTVASAERSAAGTSGRSTQPTHKTGGRSMGDRGKFTTSRTGTASQRPGTAASSTTKRRKAGADTPKRRRPPPNRHAE